MNVVVRCLILTVSIFYISTLGNGQAESFISLEDPASSLTSGWADFQPDSNTASTSGVAIFGYRADGVLVSEAAVPASETTRSGRIYVAIQGSLKTGIAMVNPNDEDTLVSFHFTNSSGSDFGHGTFILGARSHIARFLDEDPFHGPTSSEGTLTFSSPLPISAITLRGFSNERGEFLMTTLPMAPVGEGLGYDAQILPHFADGGGWTTHFILTNPSDVALSGTVQFFNQGTSTGAAALPMALNGKTASAFDYTIMPRSAVRLVTANAGDPVQTGSIRVVPEAGNAAPSTAAVLSFKKDGITVSEASVLAVKSGEDFLMYVESQGRIGEIGSIQSGLAIVNASPFPVTVDLRISDLAGAVLATGALDLPANGQRSRFIQELVSGLPPSFQGTLRISSAFPIGITGLRGRYNERGDFLIATTPATATTAQSSAPLVFPHVVNGGGYTTQFIILSRSPVEPVSGLMSFRSEDGAFLGAAEASGMGGAELTMPSSIGQAVTEKPVQAATVTSPYFYNFDQDGVLREAGEMDQSTSPHWWLNSGAYLSFHHGRGWTQQGALAASDPWRSAYAKANPEDTGDGYYPQNIFRLTTRSAWLNARQEAYFVITANNLTDSPNRNSSNGLLLFNRYLDGDNLYYTGVRVDGAAVIKKKRNGVYYTLAYEPNIYGGVYHRTSNPNLLPRNVWIGLRSEVTNLANGSVQIRLYLDKGWQGMWRLVAEAIDDGRNSGPPMISPGYAGIRTDFMDVYFENFRASNLY